MKQGQDYAGRRGSGFIEERVTKAGVVRYLARWHDGRKMRGKTFGTVQEAEIHLLKNGTAKRGGRYVPDSELTIADLLADYLRHGSDEWSANTVALYTASVENVIVPRIGRRKVRDFGKSMARAFVRDIDAAYGSATVHRARAVLSGAFRDAESVDIVEYNPMSGIRLRSTKRKDKDVWTQDEVARLLDHVADDPMLSAWYHLALTTGIRPGEERALRWSDIDMERRTVTIQRTATRDTEGRHVISETTKTGKKRTVPIPDETVAALKAWRPVLAAKQLRTEFWRDLDLVFPSRNGNLAPPQSWDKRHVRSCEEAGVTAISPHGTRHTAATLMIEAGIDVKTVSSILGHASVAFTMNVYVKVTDSMHRTAADTIGSLLKRRA